MTSTNDARPITLSSVAERLHLERTQLFLVALCVALLVAGFVVGRAASDDGVPALPTPALASSDAENGSTLVVPTPIRIPERPKR